MLLSLVLLWPADMCWHRKIDMLTSSHNNSSHEDGTMLAKLNPLELDIFDTSPWDNYTVAGVDKVYSSVCPRMPCVLHRLELPHQQLRLDSNTGLSLFS